MNRRFHAGPFRSGRGSPVYGQAPLNRALPVPLSQIRDVQVAGLTRGPFAPVRWNDFNRQPSLDINPATLAAATPKFERVQAIRFYHRQDQIAVFRDCVDGGNEMPHGAFYCACDNPTLI